MDEKEIISVVKSIIQHQLIKCIYTYYQKNPSYVPVLAVTKETETYCHYNYGRMLITQVDEVSLFYHLRLLNPLITEPLLVGRRIFGEDFDFDRPSLNKLAVKPEAYNFLFASAKQNLKNACACGYRNRRLTLLCLYLAVLFATFAKYYFILPQVATAAWLLGRSEGWPELKEAYELIGRDNVLSNGMYQHYLIRAEKYINEVGIIIGLNPIKSLYTAEPACLYSC
ncbi:MAG: hypothetical protein MUC28_01285 [Planctomycetes bacterium]|jgi:hypothetical protein|nr:hypothetical protein [Planctomycetota bacterium]